jgi:hypothetical protein
MISFCDGSVHLAAARIGATAVESDACVVANRLHVAVVPVPAKAAAP